MCVCISLSVIDVIKLELNLIYINVLTINNNYGYGANKIQIFKTCDTQLPRCSMKEGIYLLYVTLAVSIS